MINILGFVSKPNQKQNPPPILMHKLIPHNNAFNNSMTNGIQEAQAPNVNKYLTSDHLSIILGATKLHIGLTYPRCYLNHPIYGINTELKPLIDNANILGARYKLYAIVLHRAMLLPNKSIYLLDIP